MFLVQEIVRTLQTLHLQCLVQNLRLLGHPLHAHGTRCGGSHGSAYQWRDELMKAWSSGSFFVKFYGVGRLFPFSCPFLFSVFRHDDCIYHPSSRSWFRCGPYWHCWTDARQRGVCSFISFHLTFPVSGWGSNNDSCFSLSRTHSHWCVHSQRQVSLSNAIQDATLTIWSHFSFSHPVLLSSDSVLCLVGFLAHHIFSHAARRDQQPRQDHLRRRGARGERGRRPADQVRPRAARLLSCTGWCRQRTRHRRDAGHEVGHGWRQGASLSALSAVRLRFWSARETERPCGGSALGHLNMGSGCSCAFDVLLCRSALRCRWPMLRASPSYLLVAARCVNSSSIGEKGRDRTHVFLCRRTPTCASCGSRMSCRRYWAIDVRTDGFGWRMWIVRMLQLRCCFVIYRIVCYTAVP